MDKSMTLKIAAVLVVVIVVAAACIVVFTGNDDDEESYLDSTLMIRGNADNDYKIDQNDMSIVEDVINGDKSLDDYPLADVNNDGVVDNSDVSILQDMIDRKEGITVYVETLNNGGNAVTVEVTYPLRNVVTYASNMEMATAYAGGGQYVAGYFTMNYENAETSVSSSAVDLKGSARTISDSAWANFTTLDATLMESTGTGVGALLVDYSGIAQITDERVSDLEAAGIPLIIYEVADSMTEIATVITLSYLFGEETEPIGAQYYSLCNKVLGVIEDKLSGISDDDANSYIAFTMYIYICGPNSTFNSTGNTVYGVPYSDINSEFASTYTGNSTKMASVEALSNYTDVDRLINNRSMDWQTSESDIASMIVETWEHSNSGVSSAEYFAGFEDKLVYINNLLPGPAKLAYWAAAMYPDIISYDWAEEILQECIDVGLIPLQGYTVDQIVPYFDYDMYLSYKS